MANKIKFFVVYKGFTFMCVAWFRGGNDAVIAVALDNDAPGTGEGVRVWRDPRFDAAAERPGDDEWRAVRLEINQRLEMITDLLNAEMPWSALLTCRHAPTLVGMIINAVERRRLEAMRPYRRPAQAESSK
jgi:hypothetical protein